MKIPLISLALMGCLAAAAFCSPRAQAPTATLSGRWKVEFILSDSRPHAIQFDADDSGAGTFLLLDKVSSLVEVHPTKATWSQLTSEVTFSGDMEFPLGNVGREVGTLTFTGALTSPQAFSGEVSFVNVSKDQPTKNGTFSATRVDVPSVRLLSLNSGGKVKRGRSVTIEWSVQGGLAPSTQQLFLSTDDGASFNPLSPLLGGDERSFIWEVLKTLHKTKKALIRVRVNDAAGKAAEDISDSTFRIK